jgi:hypothetical protein
MAEDESRLRTDSAKEQEIAMAWALEAERRDREMDATGDEGIPAEVVFLQIHLRRQHEP